MTRYKAPIVTAALVICGGLAATPASTPAPAGPRSFRVEVSGGGPPMILIPGLSSSGDAWASTVSHYEDRYTCHVLTLAGFAGVPSIDDPLLATVRTELAAYIRDRHLERPVLVGHSLGGLLALELAVDRPDLVGPVVVVDMLPFLAGAQMQAKTLEDAQPAIAAMEAYFSRMSPEQYRQYASAGTATRFMVTGDADHARVVSWSLASDPRTVGRAMAELYGTDLRPALARIASPTLVLGSWVGLHEQTKAYGMSVTRDDVVATFAAQFAALQPLHFALSETARHFIMLDDPAWFFRQVDGFLADPRAIVRERGLSQ